MPQDHVFISHSSKDDPFVSLLRNALKDRSIPVWDDSQKLRGGDKLKPEIEKAISGGSGFIAVLSLDALDSHWVTDEIKLALEVQQERPDFRVVPIIFPNVPLNLLQFIFGEEPLAIVVKPDKPGLEKKLPAILAALGHRLPDSQPPEPPPPETPVDELTLTLSRPSIFTEGGLRRGRADARLVFEPAKGGRRLESEPFDFISPLGPIEADELKKYIEEYPRYPFFELYEKEAGAIADKLPVWGRQLLAALTAETGVLDEWLKHADATERRFSIKMDHRLPKSATDEERAAANEAAGLLLSLPWEILHGERGFLFQGHQPARVRRRLPNRQRMELPPLQSQVRILLLSPRPEDDRVGFIDHRISPKALLDATERLGSLAELTILDTPTFPALVEALRKAEQAGRPFTVVHFDGHGVFDRVRGLGALCFESHAEAEQQKLANRAPDIVSADRIAAELQGFRIPMFFLDACQTAMVELNPVASVAATLLENGVASVAAMSHSVLVETARRFAGAFYQSLAGGARIGSAMLAGQRALHADPHRADLPGGKKLELQDWFVPVLYQEEDDPQIVKKLPSAAAIEEGKVVWKSRLGALPPEPPHTFVGRSRELLAVERLLRRQPWAVVRGPGGAGKTTLAAEAARWLLRTGRFERTAFVSFEECRDPRPALDALGRQLLPDMPDWSVAKYGSEAEAFQHIARALRQQRTLLVLDNLETVLPDSEGKAPLGVPPAADFISFFEKLRDTAEHTRLLFTTREPLPGAFGRGDREVRLGALSRGDALHLVSQVMASEGHRLPSQDADTLNRHFGDLVETANCHARALTLLARDIARNKGGLQGLTTGLRSLMAELDRKHPGDRENSLFASVELSLRRLPEAVREKVEALAVFHGGADVIGWAAVAECQPQEAMLAGEALVQVGLAEKMHLLYYRLDPALPTHLQRLAGPAALATLQERWAESMAQLAGFLYQQRSQDAHLASQLTRLAEPNLLAMLGWMAERAAPERVVNLSGQVESLFSNLTRPQALAFATQTREAAAKQLGGWSHARFTSEHAAGDRLLAQGNLPAAFAGAKKVLEQCLAAGDAAYPEAAYDTALAHFRLGRVLNNGGSPEKALPLLEEARQRFLVLAAAGDEDAGRMASKCLTEKGTCLLFLGQYEDAATVYQEAIEAGEKEEDWREVAVGKGQLATVRMYQKRYKDALELYEEVKDIFRQLGEESSIATIWHQIGMVHEEAGQPAQAEKAYLASLEIETKRQNREGEASTLNQLGNLYDGINRLEEAVQMCRRAAGLYFELKNIRYEGTTRSNLADTLIQLERYDEARQEILRAIECDLQFGDAAEPWSSWAVLHDLEKATGHPAAAAEARGKAKAAYRSYRGRGGESRTNKYRFIVAAEQAIRAGEAEALAGQLLSLVQPGMSEENKVFIQQLCALLRGGRSPQFAEDQALSPLDAVELELLLGRLAGAGL